MTRIQIDLNPDQVAEMKHLMELAGMDTYKEFFNNALTLIAWAVEEKRSGKFLAAVDPADMTYSKLVMPALEKAAKCPAPVAAAAVSVTNNIPRSVGSSQELKKTKL